MGKEEQTGRGYSPDVAEILERKPYWMVRKGTLIAAVIFGMLLIASYFVPYPERLNCEADFLIPQPGNGDEQILYGMIRLPVKYETVVKTGSGVRIIVLPDEGGNPVRTEGVVQKITRDTTAGFILLMVGLDLPAEVEKTVREAGTAKAQINIGTTSLLQQVFRPIISIIRGSKVNRK